jgi:ribosomal protein L11 methyltransferase
MEWVELRLVVPRVRVDALAKVAFAHGSTGVQEDEAPGSPRKFRQPWDTEDPPVPMYCMFRAWFAPEAADAAEEALGKSGEVERIVVKEEDWAESWKQHHHRVEVSPRLAVSPPWDALPGDIVIKPGQAFGTGDHPTTLACLGGIDRLADGLTRCLDVGCGSGVLALAAAKLGLDATGIDIEAPAIESAREAAHANGLQARFSMTPLEDVQGSYDLVVANLYAEVLTMMAPDLLRLASRHVVLAGILADRADRVIEALSPPLALVSSTRSGDWVSLHLERLS